MSQKQKMSYNIDDLVVLKPGKVEGSADIIPLTDFKDENLIIDLKNGSWSYCIWKNLDIGQSYIYEPFKENPCFGVIGVYYKKDMSHIFEMMLAANSFYGRDIKYL